MCGECLQDDSGFTSSCHKVYFSFGQDTYTGNIIISNVDSSVALKVPGEVIINVSFDCWY
jgi:hypothetical protein